MKKLIAKRNILYDGKQYKAGEALPAYNAEMVKLWLECDSAAWDNGAEPEENKPDAESNAGENKPKTVRKAKASTE